MSLTVAAGNTKLHQILMMQIYTENWVNSPGQMEDNSWQAFVSVPKDNWYIAKVRLFQFRILCEDMMLNIGPITWHPALAALMKLPLVKCENSLLLAAQGMMQ